MRQLSKQRVVVVTGDVTIDWNIGRLQRARGGGFVWDADDMARARWQPGGAALLAELVEAVARGLATGGGPKCDVRQVALPDDGTICPDHHQFHHSYAMWMPYKHSQEGDESGWVWRVHEYLGLDPADSTGRMQVTNDPPAADLVVLDDAGLGFRDQRTLWPKAIAGGQARCWVLLKMASPVAQGDLWEYLVAWCADRLVAVIPINDLRRTDVQISRELSWERTAQDLVWEITHNPKVNALSRCAHVVISLGTAGALLISRSPATGRSRSAQATWESKLFFDPHLIEGMWGREHEGGMIGYTTCLAAAIARQLLLSPGRPDLARGIQSGVSAMRQLARHGYGSQDPNGPMNPPRFPTAVIADELAKDASPLKSAPVQDPVQLLHEPAREDATSGAGYWTLLRDLCVGGRDPAQCMMALEDTAAQIAVDGPEVALQGVPLGRFGNLVTADRHEIEGYRSIRLLMAEYHQRPQKHPLSIAVFGPPGSGKSFGVEEVAKTVLPEAVEVLSFNLSQFSAPSELVDALHRVRDVGLSGKVPLVFWDEFDTELGGQRYGWLRYFLAPMQDGRFQDGQISHHIGPAIFVFAGGTCACIAEFDRRNDEEFKRAKGPDMLSRLKGYVNVVGPNQADESDPSADPHYLIRRAILLRVLMQRHAPHLFRDPRGEGTLHMDPGVLRAFLRISRYKHGARSMEAVITMSTLARTTRFERSCLPAAEQLDLHVDGLEFLSLVQLWELQGELLETLAEAAHLVFCESQRRRAKPAPAAKLTYSQLSDHLKDQNRDLVRDIPSKLASAGYVMIPARSNEPPFRFPGPDLERLAEDEHNRWMAAKVAAKWRYGRRRNDKKKTNPALLPWRRLSREERARLDPAIAAAIGTAALPETEKRKDRALIRGIPRVLAKAGYAIVKLHGR